MEMLCATYAKRLPLIVARPFNYTGVGQSQDFLIPKIVAHARTRQPNIRLGNLAIARDFSDVRMIVDAYLRLLQEPRALGSTFQLCAGTVVSIRQLLDIVGGLSGHAMDVIVDPHLIRAGEVISLCGTAAHVESVIGPLRHVPLSETLGWMLADAC
jgi:nucleoside-diphosphate-sugar epimerase